MGTNEIKHPGSCRFYKAGDWELFIFYSARRTKSERAFGVLLHEGDLYDLHSQTDEVINTDLGKMKHYDLEADSFRPEGWLFEGHIPRSDE